MYFTLLVLQKLYFTITVCLLIAENMMHCDLGSIITWKFIDIFMRVHFIAHYNSKHKQNPVVLS